ncbi:MAG: hypothetical protein HOV83_10060 [Catenulispora sp.]|nr:hypothetical protein [Catenulispora sp.]
MMLDAHAWPLALVLLVSIAAALRNKRAVAPHQKQGAVTLTPAGVTIAGRTFAWGEPMEVPREHAVNPWFVSAAIQWYANHPEERPGIGTQEGHDRLRAALEAADPVDLPASPLPRNLVLGSWLTWTGVTVAILSAIGDVVLAFAFRPELERPDPLSPGSGNDWELIVGFAFVWLTAAALLGVFALGVLRAVRRSRSESARVLLAILAAPAFVSTVNPIGSPILALADSGTTVGLLVSGGWILGKFIVAASATGTFFLLLSAPVRAYTSTLAPTPVVRVSA